MTRIDKKLSTVSTLQKKPALILNKKKVLSEDNIDELKVWEYILGFQPILNERFKNPRRNDKKGRAILSPHPTNNSVMFFDPADPLHQCNAIKAIMLEKGLNYGKALDFIRDNVGISENIVRKITKKSKGNFVIKYTRRDWLDIDKQYWCIGGITTYQLEKENCYPVLEYWCGADELNYKRCTTPVYANHIKDRIKLYGPKNRLFLTNITNYIGGNSMFKGNEVLILTKNLKSYLCLTNIGYDVRYLPSESTYIPEDFFKVLDKFKEIWTLFDNDKAGIEHSKRIKNQLKDYNVKIKMFKISGTYLDIFKNKKKITDAYDIVASGRDLKEEMKICK